MKIIKLEAENIKRLTAISIEPTENLVEISGKNESGKTSTLDSIMFALGGKDKIQELPLKRGEKKGRTFLDLGKYKITRTFTAAGGGTLKVEGNDGAEYKKAQTLLDSFLNDLTFDPLEFVKAKPDRQREMLLSITPIPFDTVELESLYPPGIDLSTDLVGVPKDDFLWLTNLAVRKVSEQRTVIGRDRDRKKGAWESVQAPAVEGTLPEAPLSITALMEARSCLDAQAKDRNSLLGSISSFSSGITLREDRMKVIDAEIRRLVDEKTELERQATDMDSRRCSCEKGLEEFPEPNYTENDLQIQKFEQINEAIRRRDEKKQKGDEYLAAEHEYKFYSDSIENIRTYREKCLAAAEFPIPGLSINQDGILTLDDVPIDQRGDSKKILLGLTICEELNPELRVMLIREGNDIDGDNMELLRKWAEERDFQVWIERCADSPKGHLFYIEDGGIYSEKEAIQKQGE